VASCRATSLPGAEVVVRIEVEEGIGIFVVFVKRLVNKLVEPHVLVIGKLEKGDVEQAVPWADRVRKTTPIPWHLDGAMKSSFENFAKVS
jgi:hypothetical protein